MHSRQFLALFFFVISSRAFAVNFPVEIFEYIDDTKVVAFINKSDINPSLTWQPFKGEPPLTLADALQGLKKYLATEKVGLSSALMSEIELKQIPHHKGNWHYLVKMLSEKEGVVHNYYFIILMNGKVIPAVKEVESFK